jgi:hypothetical protein
VPFDFFKDEIAVVDGDGSNRRKLRLSDEVVDGLKWLPDGRLAYWTHSEDGSAQRSINSRLYALRDDGSAEVMYEGKSYLNLSISPDEQWLAVYESLARVGQVPHIAFLAMDATVQSEFDIAGPAPGWSPDGYYYYFLAGNAGALTLVRIRPGGAAETVLADALPEPVRFIDANDQFTKLGFISSANERLYVIDLAKRLTTLVAADRGLSVGRWSPGGGLFLYATGNGIGLDRLGIEPRVWVYRAAQGDSLLLLEGTFVAGLGWTRDANALVTIHGGSFAPGLYTIGMTDGAVSLIHAQEKMSFAYQTTDGRAFAVHRDSCWLACEPGAIDVTFIAGNRVQSLPYRRTPFIEYGMASLVWGGDALVRANSNGDWTALDDEPDSIYRFVALSADETQLAFVRSRPGRTYNIEIDLRTGAHREIDDANVPSVPRTQTPPALRAQYALFSSPEMIVTKGASESRIPLRRIAGCNQFAGSPSPELSPGGSYVAWNAPCLGGVIVVDVTTKEWAVLLGAGWCHPSEDRSVRWRGDTTLVIVAGSTLC